MALKDPVPVGKKTVEFIETGSTVEDRHRPPRLTSEFEKLSDGVGRALEAVPRGREELADTIGVAEDGADNPIESGIVVFAEEAGKALGVVSIVKLELDGAIGTPED